MSGSTQHLAGRRRPTSRPVEGRPDGSRSGGPAIEAVLARARPLDVALLGLVPVALVGVFLLPRSVVDAWRLAVLDPTLPTAYLSHFVHGTPGHLVANLAGYALLAPLSYVLCLSAGRRSEFRVVFATFVLAFPFVLSGLNVMLPRPSVVYGASGIVMALLGFVPLAVGWHVEARFDAPIGDAAAPFGFFLGAGIIAAIAAPPTPLLLTGVVLTLAAGVGYVRSAAASAGGVAGLVSGHDLATPGRLELAVAGFLAVGFVPFAAFPPDPAGAGVVLNVYEHALGYCLGFVGPFATFALLDRAGDALE